MEEMGIVPTAIGTRRRKNLIITVRRSRKDKEWKLRAVNSQTAKVNVPKETAITVTGMSVLTNPDLKGINLLKMISLPKNKRFHLKSMFLLFIVSAICACDKQTVYHAFQSVPGDGWLRQDTLCFEVAVPDSQTYYKLSVEIRNRSNYPYQNLNLSVSYDNPDSIRISADTLNAVLTTKEGIWTGDGWGGLYQSAISAGSIKIGKAGNYLFKIAYTLPDEKLRGINDVGIKLER